jgi:PBP1b-binding outer membrane lipoprotein LpoB
MPNVTRPAAAALAALFIAGCADDANPDQNVVITNTIPEGADIEAVPPNDSVPEENAVDPPSPEERGDGDDMVNIIDDTGNAQ